MFLYVSTFASVLDTYRTFIPLMFGLLAYRGAPASAEMLPPYILPFVGLISSGGMPDPPFDLFSGGLEIFLPACGFKSVLAL